MKDQRIDSWNQIYLSLKFLTTVHHEDVRLWCRAALRKGICSWRGDVRGRLPVSLITKGEPEGDAVTKPSGKNNRNERQKQKNKQGTIENFCRKEENMLIPLLVT